MFILQIPFREAHGLSGCCVALAEKKQCKLSELTLEDFKTVRYIFVVRLSISNIYTSFDLTEGYSQYQQTEQDTENYLSVLLQVHYDVTDENNNFIQLVFC